MPFNTCNSGKRTWRHIQSATNPVVDQTNVKNGTRRITFASRTNHAAWAKPPYRTPTPAASRASKSDKNAVYERSSDTLPGNTPQKTATSEKSRIGTLQALCRRHTSSIFNIGFTFFIRKNRTIFRKNYFYKSWSYVITYSISMQIVTLFEKKRINMYKKLYWSRFPIAQK